MLKPTHRNARIYCGLQETGADGLGDPPESTPYPLSLQPMSDVTRKYVSPGGMVTSVEMDIEERIDSVAVVVNLDLGGIEETAVAVGVERMLEAQLLQLVGGQQRVFEDQGVIQTVPGNPDTARVAHVPGDREAGHPATLQSPGSVGEGAPKHILVRQENAWDGK